MFKKCVMILLPIIAVVVIALSACGNQQFFDTTWTFRYAMVNGEKIAIESWRDYENSDMIQFTDTNGTTYLTHSSNVILSTK